jgi:hypothetical protein
MRGIVVAALAFSAVVLSAAPAGAGHYSGDGKSWCYGDDAYADTYCVPLSRNNGGGGPSYGAIAATATTGDFYGYSYGFGSQKEAEQKALGECDASAGKPGSCMIATWFYNECGGLAQGADGSWGADWADTEKAAGEKALAECRSADTSGACHVVKTYCSR